jgi:PAS domain S-box-containing protein
VFDEETLRFLAVNDAALRKYGWSREEFLNLSVLDVRPLEDHALVLNAIRQNRDRNGVEIGVFRHCKKDGTVMDMEITVSSILFETRPCRLCMMNDITERKQAEAKLRQSEQRFIDMLSDLQLISLILDVEGNIAFCNDYLLKLTGWKRDEILGLNWFEKFIPNPPVNFLDMYKRSMKEGVFETYRENPIITKAGDLRLVSWSNTILRGIQGNVIGLASIGEDITERKNAEQSIRRSEALFRAVVENSHDGIVLMDAGRQPIYVSPSYERISGYSPEERMQINSPEYLHPDDVGRIANEFNLLIQNPGMVLNVEYRLAHKRGNWAYVETTATNLLNDPHIKAIVLNVRDITDRKRTQEELGESEARFRGYFEQSVIGVAVTSPDKGWLEVNQAVCDELGYTREELSHLTWAELTHPDDIEADSLQFSRVLAGEIDSYRMEKRFIRKDGQVVHVDLGVRCKRKPDGQVDYFLALLSDITERKLADENLRKSEERFQWAMEASQDGVWDWDVQSGDVYYSPAYFVMLGYPPGQLPSHVNSWIELIHPDDRQKTLNVNMDCVENRCDRFEVEYRMRALDGTWKWILGMGKAVHRGADGIALRMVGTHTDITERRQAEEILARREADLARAQAIAHLGSYSWDVQAGKIEWSEELKFIWGLGDLEPAHEDLISMIHPDDRARVEEAGRLAREKNVPFEVEYRIIRPDGSYRFVHDRAETIRDSNGLAIKMFGTVLDITQRRQAEDALRASENFMRLIVDNEPECVKIVAPGGALIEMNPAGLAMIEADSLEQVRGMQITNIIAPEYRSAFSELHKRVMKGESGVLEFEIIGFKGTRRWLETHAVPLRNGANQIEAHLAVTRDITERKRVEDALRENEEKLRVVFNTMEEGMALNELILDENGNAIDYRILEVNAAFEEISFLTREQAVGNTATEIYNMTQEQIAEFWKERKSNAGAIKTDMYIPQLNRWRHISTSKFDQKNRFVTMFFDNTDKKNSEIALRESEERFHSLFDNATIGMYRTTPDGQILMSNPAGIRILGYDSFEDISKRNLEDRGEYLPTYERNEFHNLMKKAGSITGLESTWKRKDGSIIYIRESATAVKDGNGNIIYYDGTFEDITEQRKAEEAQQEADERYRMLVEFSPDGIGVHSEGRIVYVNPAIAKLLHANNSEELIGMPIMQFIHPDYRQVVMNRVRDGYDNRTPSLPLEEVFVTLDGKPLDVEVVAIPIAFKGKSATQVIIRDITQRKRSEKITQTRLRLVQFAPLHSLEELLRTTLDELEALTGSTIGFYHFVETDQKSIWLQTWSTNTLKEMCKADASLSHYSIDKAGVWVDCVHERRPVVLNDYSALPPTNRKGMPDGHAPVHRMLTVPILRNDRIVAIIGIGNKPQDYDENDVDVVSQIADLAWDITDQKRAEERLQEQVKHLQSLHIIDNAINSSFNLNITLKILVDEVASELKVDAVSLLLFNKTSFTLEYAASHGFKSDALKYSKLQLGQGYAGQAIREGRVIHVQDLSREDGALSQSLMAANEHFVAYYGAPLFAKGQIVGVIEVLHRSPLNPTLEWVEFLDMLAGQAAIAIDNAQLFENLQRSNFDLTLAYDATIEGWSHAMDLRDRETEGHTKRVTNQTLKLARQIGVPESDIVHIHRGALLHDMGKMGIPDAILLKPGPLTEDEMSIMRRHPIYAYEMLSNINYLKPALDIPYCHHEKWNGTGYPQGLKEKEIPVAARIFAVVDVWDALTSDRPYRGAWSKERTIEHIKAESGKHFDPDVVTEFLKLIEIENSDSA